MSEKNKRRSRGGGREARRELRSSQAQNTINKPYIKRNIPVYDLVSDEVCELIENNAEIILEEIGIDFRDDKEALSILKSNGKNYEFRQITVDTFGSYFARKFIFRISSIFS